jgi:hypothetical protein
MSPQEIDTLRKEVKHKMVELGLDRRGSYAVLLPRLLRPTHNSSLIMALSGYRSGPGSQAILEDLLAVLSTWPPENA